MCGVVNSVEGWGEGEPSKETTRVSGTGLGQRLVWGMFPGYCCLWSASLLLIIPSFHEREV